MSEEELRQLIETNFRLLGLSVREIAGRTSEMGHELAEVEQGLARVQQDVAHVRSLAE